MNGNYNQGINFKFEAVPDLVSIVIPTFNRSKTIARSVRSCLNQTYEKIEVIVVDDCSTDNTIEVVSKINDPRVRCFRLDRNSGACIARNVGAENANGEWIAYQDSDDEWLPEKLEKQIAFMRNGNYDFSFCQASLVLPNGKVILSPLDKYGNESDRDWYSIFLTDFPVSTQKFVFNRPALLKYGFDPEIKKSQDKDIALLVAHDFKVGYLHEALVNIYATQDSITYSGNHQKKYDSIIRIYQKHEVEISSQKKALAFFNEILGDYSFQINKKLAIHHYRTCIITDFTIKRMIKYLLTVFNLRKFF